MKNERHLFSLAPGLVNSASEEEVMATALGLMEVGLYALPYPRDVYVQVSCKEMVGPEARDGDTVIYGPLGEGQAPFEEFWDARDKPFGYREAIHPDAATHMGRLLIVLLATRNAHKERKEHKAAKLGIGKRAKTGFASTTTISFPTEMANDPENPPTGTHRAPHLRRGHTRRQRYGKGNELEKTIWIAPMFVNADPDFVATRKKYRIK